MKRLIDILAVELKRWPEFLGDAVGQAVDGTLHNEMDPEDVEIYRTLESYTLCKHFISDIVTRTEWQAVVDALNAPKVVEWDGVSLPPKGTAVEVRFACEKIGSEWPWHSGVVVASGPQPEGGAMVAVEDNGFTVALRVTSDFIRPARTAEQVDAEERDKGIQEICDTLGWLNIRSDGSAQEAAILYDAGYRK